MPEIGNSLREARIRRGLSIKDVEDATKIRSKYLEALEEDDFEVLPGSTCVKGFLRQYAIFLKLDPDVLVETYRSQFEHREEPAVLRTDISRAARGRGGSPRTRISGEPKKKPGRRNQRGYVLVGIVALIVVALLAWFGSGRGQKTASIDASNISSSTTGTSVAVMGASTTLSVGAETSSTVTSAANPDGTEGTTGGGESSAVSGNVTLTLTVTEGSCWLVVNEDSENGAQIYAGTLSASGHQTFNSAKRYWMRVGRPEALALSVNGVSYSLAAPEGAFVVTEAGVERAQ